MNKLNAYETDFRFVNKIFVLNIITQLIKEIPLQTKTLSQTWRIYLLNPQLLNRFFHGFELG